MREDNAGQIIVLILVGLDFIKNAVFFAIEVDCVPGELDDLSRLEKRIGLLDPDPGFHLSGGETVSKDILNELRDIKDILREKNH